MITKTGKLAYADGHKWRSAEELKEMNSACQVALKAACVGFGAPEECVRWSPRTRCADVRGAITYLLNKELSIPYKFISELLFNGKPRKSLIRFMKRHYANISDEKYREDYFAFRVEFYKTGVLKNNVYIKYGSSREAVLRSEGNEQGGRAKIRVSIT